MSEWTEAIPNDPALRAAVLELETHAADLGWDQPAKLFALVNTTQLLRHEPDLAGAMGVRPDSSPLTAVEQDHLPDSGFEEALLDIEWPDEVTGCAAILERFVLPPSVEAAIPDDAAGARAFAEAHPERQEVRIVAAALRDGATYCALRLRAHDEPGSVLEAPDLVPTLLQLLQSTLDDR